MTLDGTFRRYRPLPGDAAWWMFLSAEFLTLGIFFVAFAFSRQGDLESFEAGKALLDPDVGFLNTLVLITSGYFAARAVRSIEDDAAARTRTWLILAAMLGLVFLGIKTWEYVGKFEAGIGLSTSSYFFFYFFLTGFHYLHVMLGVGFLGVMAWRCGRRGATECNRRNVASSAAFWHMLDLVWVILFPLLYLA